MMRDCLTASEQQRLCAGDMSADAEASARAHLSICVSCRAHAAQLIRGHDELVARLAALGIQDAPASAPPTESTQSLALDANQTKTRIPATRQSADRASSDIDQLHPQTITISDATRIDRNSVAPAGNDGSSKLYVLNPSSDAETEQIIRGYKLIREIKRGGQGIVYQAIQESTKADVAIKVLKEGTFSGPADVIRFQREVRILAQLRHPGIVAIHDSGRANGHFFYVMDYIDGGPLSVDAISRDTSIEQALNLFAQICDSIQAAHLRGVIHRDLKPGNILIDRSGAARILDFGLAKAIRDDVIEESAIDAVSFTGQFFGSVPWASPEQAEANPTKIDLRSDIYSLGVILYQMLTGRFPYEVVGPPTRVLETILHDEPLRPSSIRAAIDDEVETIVLKCLDKSPDRRYQTAGDLAQDVRRYLASEPIEAKRDSALYVLRKRLRKHWIAVSVVAAFAILVISSAVALGVLYQKERTQARIAAAEARNAQREASQRQQFQDLMEGVLTHAKPDKGGGQMTIRDVLDATAQQVADDPPKDTVVAAALRGYIGDTYLAMGAYKQADEHLQSALRLKREVLAANDPDIADTLESLGRLAYEWNSNFDESERLILEAAAIRGLSQADQKTALAANWLQLGEILYERGRAAQAWPLFQKSYALWRTLDAKHPSLADALNDIAYAVNEVGEFETAEALYRLAVAADEKNPNASITNSATTLTNLGIAQVYQGLIDLGEPSIREALKIRRKVAGETSKEVANSLAVLAYVRLARGDAAGAESLYRDAIAKQQVVFGPKHQAIAFSTAGLAAAIAEQLRADEADAIYMQSCDMYVSLTGKLLPFAPLMYFFNRAALHDRRGDLEGAEQLYAAAIDAYRAIAGSESLHLARAIAQLGLVRCRRGESAAGERDCREALDMRRRLVGDAHPAYITGLIDLADALRTRGDEAQAEGLLRLAVERRNSLEPPLPWVAARAEMKLGICIAAQNREFEAGSLLESASRTLSRELGEHDPRAQEVNEILKEVRRSQVSNP